ncbi:MAG: hypothetical protein FWG66_06750, partial [Spirochaetes bacterium]|nr:hypothetical protein [Spirochaetota bacterium]
QSAISNQQSAISNQQSAISNQQSAISNQQSAIKFCGFKQSCQVSEKVFFPGPFSGEAVARPGRFSKQIRFLPIYTIFYQRVSGG